MPRWERDDLVERASRLPKVGEVLAWPPLDAQKKTPVGLVIARR